MRKKEKNNIEIVGYPFVKHVDQNDRPTIPLSNLKDYYVRYHNFLYSLFKNGTIKIMGYEYDFKPYLNRYIYFACNTWTVCYAPNKTIVRKVNSCKVIEIYEIPNPFKKIK
jgi:hypothetical protein